MKRKLFITGLLVVALASMAFAADSARRGQVGGQVEMVIGVGDGSSGYMLEIGSNSGSAYTIDAAQAVSSQFGDGQIYTGSCKIQTICIEGETAGDYAAIYDNTSATGTAKFDPRIDTNYSSTCIPTGGAPFATGIYVDAIDADVLVTAVYDY